MRIRKKLTKIFILSIFVFTMAFTSTSVEASSNYKAGTLLKIKGVKGAAIYQIGADGKKYVYPDQNTFKTWYDDFSEVLEISRDTLDEYSDGGTVTFQAGTRLITHYNTARVYAVGEDGELTHVPDEATALRFYGMQWAELVTDVDPGIFSISYKVRNRILSEDNLPEGTLIEEEDTGDYFLIEDGQRRRVNEEILRIRSLIKKNIIKLKRLHDIYDIGDEYDDNDDGDDEDDGDDGDDGDNDDEDPILADIKVDSIIIEATSPTVNATTTITAYIKNSGDVSLTNAEIIFDTAESLEDFVITSTVTSTISIIDPLVSGETVSVVWTGYFIATGTKVLTVSTDDANILDESDETNNTLIENVTILALGDVDLTVSDIMWNPSSPIENATSTTITAYIKNSGDVALTDYEPIFDILKSLEDFVVNSTSTSTVSIIDPLEADEEASIVWTGYFDSDGQKRLSVTTDDADTLDESDEGNNNALEYVTVIKNIAS